MNVHFNFKPELYRGVCRLLRNYHNISWDYGKNSKLTVPLFPVAANKVDWDRHVYGKWKAEGYEVDASVMFGKWDGKEWLEHPEAAFNYAKALAACLGPSGERKLLTSVEIGNEPTGIKGGGYGKLLESMAKGYRAGDPKLKIATAAMALKEDKYAKDVAELRGREDLFDILNFHVYPSVEGWPTWRRSHPEDPDTKFLSTVQGMIDHRDRHLPGKELWLTEFGYDACTDAAMAERKKPFEKWIDVSDRQQARWIVRAFLLLTAMDLDRAYLFYYDDQDESGVHHASGITRKFNPKPAFHAMSHLYRTLGDYRFRRVVLDDGEVKVLEFAKNESCALAWVAWSPTGDNRCLRARLPKPPRPIRHAERSPLSKASPEKVEFETTPNGQIELILNESPNYLFMPQ